MSNTEARKLARRVIIGEAVGAEDRCEALSAFDALTDEIEALRAENKRLREQTSDG